MKGTTALGMFFTQAILSSPHLCVVRNEDGLLCLAVRNDNDPECWAAAEDVEAAGAAASAAVSVALHWHECGMPQLEPTPKLAASLMATSLGDVDDLRLPWPCIMIRCAGLGLSIELDDGVAPADVLVIRETNNDQISVFLAGITPDGDYIDLHHRALTIPQLLVDPEDLDEEPRRIEGVVWGEHEITERDLRTLRLAGRLAVGCILELASSPSTSRRRALRLSERAQIASAPVKFTAYELTRPVRVDCRQMVEEYLEGGGKSPAVRSMVRGHWKRQPHGPRREERKWIHIEPYWRGPEDGPMAVRPHRLGKQ